MRNLNALIKDQSHYKWYTYQGDRPLQLMFRGKPVSLRPGGVWGIRRSHDGKHSRVVLENLGPNYVFSDPDVLPQLIEQSKANTTGAR